MEGKNIVIEDLQKIDLIKKDQAFGRRQNLRSLKKMTWSGG
jgi:hypothetical protein